MSSVRLHEKIRTRSCLSSLSDLSDIPMPLFDRDAFEFQAYLSSLHMLLRQTIADQPDEVLEDSELRDLRTRLSNILDVNAELLNKPDEREARWTRAMLVWVVICQLNIVIHKLWQTHRDASELTAFMCSAHAELVQQRLCTSTKPILSYSMSELILAVDALRSRLDSLTTFGGAIVRYIIALECRASMLVAAGGDLETFDVPDYRRVRAGSVLVTCHLFFLPYTMWTFVWMKRYIRMYTEATSTNITAMTIMNGIPTTWRSKINLAKTRINAFLLAYAKSMKTDEYARNFRKRAYVFESWPGEREACTFRYGGNTEKSTINDILGTQRPIDATSYLAHSKYKQAMSAWLCSRAPTGDRNAFLQQFAFLHILDCFFRGRMQVPLLQWCVVLYMCQHESTNYLARLSRAFKLSIPFITQRLGRYAVIVPKYREKRFDAMFSAEEAGGERNSILIFSSSSTRTGSNCPARYAQSDDDDDDDDDDEFEDPPKPLFMDNLDVETAFAVWAIAMLQLHDGVIHGSVTIKPFLESLLLSDETSMQTDEDAQSVQGDI